MDKDLKPMPDEFYLGRDWVNINNEPYIICRLDSEDGFTKYTRATDCPAVDVITVPSAYRPAREKHIADCRGIEHLCDFQNTVTTTQALDVEALKRELGKEMKECHVFAVNGAMLAIDYMHSRNLIRGAVEPIEGLDVAINVLEDDLVLNKQEKLWFDIVIKAASKYNEMMKGE